MPNFPVTNAAQRISQALTQEALIQNVGTETVYLDSVSTVGPFSYGLGLVPRSTVNWPRDRELWAVTESAPSEISVMYNAEGVGLSEVSAVVSGTVEIGNPVNVQGGGEILYVGSGSVPGSSSIQIPVPAPPSGLTYYGLRVYLSHNGPTLAEPLVGRLNSNGPGFASSDSACVASPGAGGLILGRFGDEGTVEYISPMATQYPVDMTLSNRSATACNYSLQVNGISHSEPKVTDASIWTRGNVQARIAFNSAAAGSYAIIAASFSDRFFLITTSTGTVGSFVVDEMNPVSGAWQTTQERAQNSVYQSASPLTAGIQAETNSIIRVPGTGNLHRIRNTNAVTGNTFVSYLGGDR